MNWCSNCSLPATRTRDMTAAEAQEAGVEVGEFEICAECSALEELDVVPEHDDLAWANAGGDR